ncbi:MAG: stalk domain-containing protein [Tissierellales bacterium]|nr:stalk domain-containing protein [Tissierellales bacterium]
MKKLKKIVAVACFLLAIGGSSVQAEDQSIGLMINEDSIKLTKELVINEDKTYISTRQFAELMGYDVEWKDETKEIIFKNEKAELIISTSEPKVIYNGFEIEVDDMPLLEAEGSFLPIRSIGQFLGCSVEWDEKTRSVKLSQEGLVVNPEYIIQKKTYTDEELQLLSRIVDVESGDRTIELRLAVANVVLNRVKSSRFPNSVKDVVYQVDVHKQFPPAHKSNFLTRAVDDLSIEAARRALEGENNIENCLFFNLRPFKSKSNDFYKKIEGEYFYR